MPPARNRRVAILGGGMAGLAAAWALSGRESQGEFDVCVFESEPHLGGKGGSTRGVHGRIEEHGLHVWLGYYENAFRLIRDVYGELDRPATDPTCAIATWRDAFAPSDVVGVGDGRDGTWSHWVATFSRNLDEPGARTDNGRVPSVLNFVERGLGLLLDFWASVRSGRDASESIGVVLSGSPEPPCAESAPQTDLAQVLRGSEIAAMIGALESIRVLRAGIPRGGSLPGVVLGNLERMRGELLARVDRGDDARRATGLADIVISAIVGIIRDGLLTDRAGFAAIDHLDFREWLARQGARSETLDSPLIRGMYDLVFAYADGDPARPRFPAGLGLFLAGKLFFEYRGSIFWRTQAGMGDVVFAPLYQALRARGVQFRFSHRAQHLHLTPDHSRVGAIDIAYDAAVGAGQPSLQRVKDLPCFASVPRRARDSKAERVVLKGGVDFDDVVLATSLAPIRSLGAELLADSARWQELLDRVATVPTQSLQVWLREGERELGWRYPGATVSGYPTPFDTYASVSHLIPREAWPSDERPRTLGYFCSVLERQAARDPDGAHRRVRANAARFLARDAGRLWPGVISDDGFRWELLCGANGAEGRARLDSQYWRANVEPAAQYVQALPGTGDLRLRANASGYENLFLAGDWIDCGLNAGCIEAAVLAGLQAANAICGRPLADGIVGSWMGFETG